MEISILPMSFAEYLQMLGIETGSAHINYNSLLNDYINDTSFPQGIKLKKSSQGAVIRYLNAIYNLNFPCRKAYLTTDEYESEAEGIKILNAAKWLLK
ncbi:MAG: hypothetical protein LBH04_05165 [Tannerellaceae bacterium]|nr:hypothetical protein [Tannerellaceae bacterium]